LPKRFYAAEPKTQVVPPMGDSITEGELKSWSKAVGEHIAVDDLVAVIETDKVAVEIRAQEAGVIKEHFAEEGSTVSVGAPLFAYEAGAEAPKKAEAPKEQPAAKAPEAPKPHASAPVAEPPKAAPTSEPKAAPAAPKAEPAKQTAQASAATGGERKVKVTRMRERIAQRLKDAQNTYAMLTTFQEADMFNLINMREDFKEEFQKKHGVKLGFMSAFVKASAAALKEIPAVNAVYDGANREIIYRDYVDISVAVATPRGLVVPVLRDCERLSFADVEKRLSELSTRARKDEITLEEMAGGTFTISNGGVYGSLMGTPIINPPQSAILGMHAINKRPVVVNDQMVIRPIMYLALTYDHRLIDGKEAVTFLRHVKHSIEDPRRLLLDL
jgi:2-oxoglutarate dehydrogenase E2 component (dihydrolipoamide succinyltransferase)